MGVVVLLEDSILHGCQQELQPVVVSGIKLVPKDKGNGAFEHGVSDLVKRANQHGRRVELGKIEFEDLHLVAENLLGDFLDTEGLARPRRAEGREAKRLL